MTCGIGKNMSTIIENYYTPKLQSFIVGIHMYFHNKHGFRRPAASGAAVRRVVASPRTAFAVAADSYLTIDGSRYSGTECPAGMTVTTCSNIVGRTDGSVQGSGWEICLDAP
jgi:hypothetical protein